MNTFGKNFRVSIYGESHGESIGITIDGVPAGISLTKEDFMLDLSRRKSGKKGTTKRIESDEPIISSGIYNNFSSGSPIHISFKNRNMNSKDYDSIKDIPRPGHADFCAIKKYKGYSDIRGGGHFSGRITLGLVAAGVIAKKILKDVKFKAKIKSLGKDDEFDIEKSIDKAILSKSTIGGVVECTVSNLPIGLGEPFFNSVESLISHIIFSIPGVRGIEFGSGFDSAKMTGFEHNDRIIDSSGKTETNNAGGINGGISNGNDIVFRVAVKPTPSIYKAQNTINLKTNKIEELLILGRHDSCFAIRTPVIIEAATAIVLADLFLENNH